MSLISALALRLNRPKHPFILLLPFRVTLCNPANQHAGNETGEGDTDMEDRQSQTSYFIPLAPVQWIFGLGRADDLHKLL